MSDTSPDLGALSLDEKRSLLRKLLQDRASTPAVRAPAPGQPTRVLQMLNAPGGRSPEAVAERPAPPALRRRREVARARPTGGAAKAGDEEVWERTNLTKNQFLVWAGQQLQPGVPLYNLTALFRIPGAVDRGHFQRAFQALVDGSDALRTVIEEVEGVPRQRVLPHVAYAVESLDFSEAADPEAHLRVWATERGREPFDLGVRLFEAALVKLAADRFVWFFKHHHIISDAWTIALSLRYVTEFYRRSREGTLEPAPALPRYQDFVAYERAQRDSPQYRKAKAYWERKLAEEVEPLALYGNSAPRRTTRVERVSRELGLERSRRLRALAASAPLATASANVGLSSVFVGLFVTYLYRISGNRRLALGAPILNRPSRAFKDTLGLFMQFAPLHFSLAEGETLASLIQKAKRELFEVLRHQRYTTANPPQQRQYEVVFNYNHTNNPVGWHFDGAPVSGNTLHSGHENDTLALQVHDYEAQGSFGIDFDFHCDVFTPAEREQTIEHFLRVVDVFCEDPGRPLREVGLLTATERRHLLVDLARTRLVPVGPESIVAVWQEQVGRTPEAAAVVCEGEQLTYRQLEGRANQLGHYLRARGVGPEAMVGVCLERSLDMVVAVLGILKAGGAYVPLDANYPRARLDFMLHDARVQVLVTQQGLLAALPETEARVVCVDAEAGEIAGEPDTAPVSGVTGANLAYVIYTSGSTGQPRGVMIAHGSLVNALRAWEEAYALRSWAGCHLQMASLSFDVFTGDLVRALCTGGRLVVCPASALVAPGELYALMRREGVDSAEFVPAVLKHLVQHLKGTGEALGFMPLLVAGSDNWPVGDYVEVQGLCGPGTRLINSYGVTEATIDSLYFEGGAAPLRDDGLVPVGRPFANTEVYILDGLLQPAPLGMPGELYIGGAGLARGYRNRPELTAERFLPHPFSGAPGARVYRTGDRARFRADGTMEFLGRLDGQVKVRGYRVEVGEVESVLAQHPGVRGVVVQAREEASGGKRLVAYVVGGREGGRPTGGELRSWAQGRLPEYMVPAAFVLLEGLPLTPNGKVDRRALPAPEGTRPELAEAYVAPRGAVEQELARIWSDVLDVEPVGIHDDFLELGGHSLLAIQLLWRVRAAFQTELPLRELFETRTIAGLALAIEQARGRSRASPIRPVPRDQELPLSFAQERLWFLDQLMPGHAFYNLSAAVRITGPMDREALEWSLNEMVRRHEILRTTFATVDGRPVQVIAPALTLTVPVVDLTDRPPSEREDEVHRLAHREAQRPFDLARGPLVRVGLLELGGEDHVLLATLHHIIADAWSTGVFIREMAALCSARVKGEPSPLPALTIQYADFAAWQRNRLQGDVLAELLAYWRRRLEGAPPVLELPTDRPRPPVQTYRGATSALEVSRRVSESLASLGRQEGVTLFMTLLAAFQAQLHRYSGQDDIVVGSPIANRDRTETEGLIGLFLNMLVLRTDLGGDPSFRTLLGRVREVCLGAYAHQDLPFEKLVQELHPERNLASEPLFQVALVLQNIPSPVIEIPGGLTARLLDAANQTARRDLTLVLWEGPQGLAGAFEYNTDLFDAVTINRMSGHLCALLEGILADPDRRLLELPLLSPAERRQLLVEHNETRTDYPRVARLHESFEAQVERTPEAVAACFEGQALTYAELNHRANRLAHYLSKRGVGPEALVGICVNRSLPMLVALLGVLKAGGAYVPLSPTSPREHLSYMLDDARVSLVLTEASLVNSLPDFAGQVVCLDTEAPVLGGESPENPVGGVAPENPAYVIYTSGSTGRPKGVVIEHRQIRNYVFAVLDRLGLAGGTFAMVQPLTVDSSQTSIFPPLVTGGCLHVISEERALTPNALAEYVVQHPIDCLKIAPSHLAALLTADRPERILPRRRLIIGGEASQREWVQRLQALAPGCTIFNHYGPTEATVGMLTYQVASGTTEIRAAVVPMGRPLPNTQAYVLDRGLEPLPIGVPGELYLGGEGLGRGYLNHPELTAERFTPHPFSEEPGARLYRTGDLARRLPDGSLEFLGRIDQQVKIRGFRIEPGEIEAVLRQHPAVREALVIAREGSPGDRYLAAYLVGHEVPSGSELRRFVGLKLPDYMVPSVFVALDALPRTPHGKVDIRALPVPGHVRPERGTPQVAPRTPLEEELAGLWSELLRIERVGIHDNFFELGGHSLLATQLASRVRATFQVELPLHRLFESPTIAGLAEAIERERPALPAPPITAVRRDGRLPLSFAQERLWFMDQLMPGHAFYNVPLAVRLHGALNLAALDESVAEIVRRHEILRTTFVADGGGPVQVIAPAARVTVPVVDLRSHDSARREAAAWELARKEAEAPFDLARGPLFRITLLRLGDADHVLLLTLHHIITDGWSTGILMHEVAVLYDAFSRGNPSPLPELPIQYVDFAHWQRQWLQGGVLDEHLDYWRHRLAGTPPLLELPTDHPRPAVQTFRGATLAFELPGNLGESLCMLGEQEGATPFMTLLAGFQALLSRYTGEEDIVVGAAIANRTRLEIEQLIGFFVNMLALRTDLGGNPSFRQLVRRVREVCLGAFAHQDLPCEKLVETLQPERNLSHMPLAQVGFALEAAPIETLTTPNLTVSRLAVDLGTVKNDLALHLWRTGQGLHGVFEYSTDLFEAATIARMATHLRILLEAIVADPDRPLGGLPLVSESDAELEQGIL